MSVLPGSIQNKSPLHMIEQKDNGVPETQDSRVQ